MKKLIAYSGAFAWLIACGGVAQFAGQSTVVGTPPPPPAPAPEPPKPQPKGFKRVEVTADHIVINEKIQFEQGKATILAQSNGLLDEIAKTIIAAPQIKKIEIQGHASSEGDAKANLKLSDDRAKAVMGALTTRGVKPEVVVAKGYGSERKLVEEKTEDDREKNRRVEFLILDPAPPAGAKPSATPATPAPTSAAAPAATTSTPVTGTTATPPARPGVTNPLKTLKK
jgi:OOP family OmpA-OmpF porin